MDYFNWTLIDHENIWRICINDRSDNIHQYSLFPTSCSRLSYHILWISLSRKQIRGSLKVHHCCVETPRSWYSNVMKPSWSRTIKVYNYSELTVMIRTGHYGKLKGRKRRVMMCTVADLTPGHGTRDTRVASESGAVVK